MRRRAGGDDRHSDGRQRLREGVVTEKPGQPERAPGFRGDKAEVASQLFMAGADGAECDNLDVGWQRSGRGDDGAVALAWIDEAENPDGSRAWTARTGVAARTVAMRQEAG